MARTRRAIGALLTVTAAQAVAMPAVAAGDPPASSVLRGRKLYVDPNAAARKQVDAWRKSRPADAQLLEREIASQPTAVWIGDWTRVVRGEVARVTGDAAAQGAL